MATIPQDRIRPAASVYEQRGMRAMRFPWLTGGTGAAVHGDMLEVSSSRVDRIDSVVSGTTTTLLGVYEGGTMASDAATDTIVDVMLLLPYHLYEASAGAEALAGLNIVGIIRTLGRSTTVGGVLTTTSTNGAFNVTNFASINDRYVADSYRTKAGTLVAGTAMQPGVSKGIPGDTSPRVNGMIETSVIALGL